MALLKDKTSVGYTFNYNIVFASVYLKERNTTSCTVTVYKDKATRDADINSYVRELTKVYEYAGSLSIPELYINLKNEVEFVDAIDA